jgi:thioredoxin-related protein
MSDAASLIIRILNLYYHSSTCTMKVFILLLFLFSSQLAVAQEKKVGPGLTFENAFSWSEIKAKAKSENKHIFVDAWTTWCGPCIYMNKKVFPKQEVGAFFNRNFINVKLQLDSTAEDSDYVKSWYADAQQLMQEWGIQYFPTFIFLNPQGELVHRAVGGSDAGTFITLGKDALNPKSQFYTIKNKYDAGKRDAVLLYSLAQASNRAGFDDLAKVVTSQYFATQKNLFTKNNLVLLRASIRSTTDQGFDLFLQQGSKVDAVLGKGEAMNFVKSIITYQYLMPILYSDEGPIKQPDWKEAEKRIKQELKQIRPEYLKIMLASLQSEHLRQLKGGPQH